MRISFLGAAGTVTGSKHLLTVGSKRVLVDCGLFQGLKALRLRNREPLPFDPKGLDAIVLTHGHLDHTGLLPVVVREGYEGPIYCTPPTADLVEILLADSARIQEEDARYANRKGFSRHDPALPLYTSEDARAVTPLLRPTGPGTDVDVGGMTLRFGLAGHILGAAWVRIEAGGRSVCFSGDLGRSDDLLIPAPEAPPAADVVVMESTYGGRDHPDSDPVGAVGGILAATAARGGVLMIPAFAVGRAQLMLLALARAQAAGMGRGVPVYLNSPMAIDVMSLYGRYEAYHRLTASAAREAFTRTTYVQTVDQSKALNERRGPLVVVAGAGMLVGGRILHHLKAFGPDDRNTLLLTGYQAPGTRGAALLGGARSMRIHGHDVPFRAGLETVDGLSAHGDRRDLLAWLAAAPSPPERVYLVHGEPDQAEAFASYAMDALGGDVQVARDRATYVLD
ncbi:MAG: MBL fold metallo-hydrolase [Longimicrobiales bacterium]